MYVTWILKLALKNSNNSTYLCRSKDRSDMSSNDLTFKGLYRMYFDIHTVAIQFSKFTLKPWSAGFRIAFAFRLGDKKPPFESGREYSTLTAWIHFPAIVGYLMGMDESLYESEYKVKRRKAKRRGCGTKGAQQVERGLKKCSKTGQNRHFRPWMLPV